MNNSFIVRTFMPLAEMNSLYLEHVLAEVDNNKTKAAKLLRIDRRTFYRRIEKKTSHGRK